MRSLLAFALMVCPAAMAQQRLLLKQYLRNPDFQWTCESLLRMEFCHAPNLNQSAVEAIGRSAENSLSAELSRAAVSSYAPRIHLFLVGSSGRLRNLTGAYAAGASQPAEHIVCFVEGHPEALTHELNHEVMTYLWGRSEPWIAEGLAASVSEPDTIDRQFRDLSDRGMAQPLATMVNPTWTVVLTPSTIIYPELGSFVKYLRTTFGTERLRQVWQGGSAGIPRVYGKSLARLERDWRASITQRGAGGRI